MAVVGYSAMYWVLPRAPASVHDIPLIASANLPFRALCTRKLVPNLHHRGLNRLGLTEEPHIVRARVPKELEASSSVLPETLLARIGVLALYRVLGLISETPR
jgi:hypothetical protein